MKTMASNVTRIGSDEDRQRYYDSATPVYLAKLAKLLGQNGAAKRLGVSNSTVSKNLASGETRRSTELASQLLLEQMGELTSSKKEAEELLLVSSPSASATQLLMTFCRGAGIKVARFEDC